MENNFKVSNTSSIRDIEGNFLENYISENKGWGQFLDGRIEHRTTQYGRYGTSAGAMVLAASGKPNGQTSAEIKPTLYEFFWDLKNPDKNSQNLVLANLFAGLAYLSSEQDPLDKELEELLIRRTPGDLWGNYWKGPAKYDPSESVFVSAMVLFSISCAHINSKLPASKFDTIKKSLTNLDSLYLESPEKHHEYQEVVFSALCRFSFYRPSKKVIKKIKQNSTRPIDISKKHIHFYDYEKEEKKVGREYYVVPREIFSVLAGASKYSPANYTLRAIKVTEKLKENVKNNSGLYVSSAGTRASTLEQGYLALALTDISRKTNNNAISFFDKTIYNAKVDREEKFYLFTSLVVIAYILSFLNSYIIAVDKDSFDQFQVVLVTASIYIIATIRDPKNLLATILGIKR